MKKQIFLIFLVIIVVFFAGCTIITERWVIDWDDDSTSGSPLDTLTIDNNVGEPIDTIKYYVDDRPPSSWDNAEDISEDIPNGYSRTFDVGPGEEIDANDGDTIWIRVSSEKQWYSTKLFAVDGFTYGNGENDIWIATVYKEP